jgi:DnaK suppressor protein
MSASTRNRQKLTQIQSALDRLERGEFGICQECEEEIPLKRLQAIPWALYCVWCQERMESMGPVEGEVLVGAGEPGGGG